MGAFFVYILKSAVCLAGFYLFYRLLLSHDTFHRFNRVALLSLLVLSCTVPLVEVTVEQPMGVEQPFLTLEEMMLLAQWESPAQADVALAASITWREVVLLLYVLGIVFFLLRNVWSLVRMLRLIKGCTMQKREDGITLITHRKRIAPFSWMKYIVISEQDLAENGREILTHECAHIRNCHSIDLLVADVCIFFQWFNPAAWLLKQELQNIHEYEADESVIAQGIDAKSYQLLLIKKAVGTRLYSMANSFNHSSLKKRITMMMKKKSNPWARAKYLYVLPLAAVAVAAFARPEVSNELKEISAVKVNDLTAIMKADEVKSVETAAISDEKEVLVKGKVYYADGAEPIPGASILIKGTKTGTLTDVDGNYNIKAPIGSTLVFSYLNMKASEVEVKEAHGAANYYLGVGLSDNDGAGSKVSNAVKVTKSKKDDAEPLKGKFADSDQDEKDPVFMVVEEMPEFAGGMAACMKFLAENIRYPEIAHKNGVEGRVILQFVVDKDGSIANPKVVRSVSPEIDVEALRVVQAMPKWKPGKQRGKEVRVRYTLPITFRLDNPKNRTEEVVVTAYGSAEGNPTEQVFQVVEEMPEFPGGVGELMKFLGRNIKYPVEAQKNKEEGRVIVQFIVEKDGSISNAAVVRGISPELNDEAIRVVSAMPQWKPGMQRGQAVRVKFSVPIMFRLQDDAPVETTSDSISTMTVNVQKNAMGMLTVRGGNFETDAPVLIMIDGKKSDNETMSKLDPKQIEAVTVLKDKDAIAEYGEEGKNGVILITTKKE